MLKNPGNLLSLEQTLSLSQWGRIFQSTKMILFLATNPRILHCCYQGQVLKGTALPWSKFLNARAQPGIPPSTLRSHWSPKPNPHIIQSPRRKSMNAPGVPPTWVSPDHSRDRTLWISIFVDWSFHQGTEWSPWHYVYPNPRKQSLVLILAAGTLLSHTLQVWTGTSAGWLCPVPPWAQVFCESWCSCWKWTKPISLQTLPTPSSS